MSNQFLEANFNGGLQAPHYFNGRLLSAEDLQADQSATLMHESWLGRASGYGVIEGLMVTQVRGTASVQITAGTGLNRVGQFIRLPNDIILSLLQQPAADQKAVNGPVNDAGRFTTCDAPGPKIGENGTSSAGAYLLTALPASRFEGQAPITPAVGNGSSSNSAGCGSKWEVEGLQFKTIRLAAFTEWSNGIFQGGVNLNAMRNLLAHWCYGSPAQPELALDPFHFPASFGGIDLLAPADLTPGDLPLAMFYWTGQTIAFVDAWPARRRLVRPDAVVETTEQRASSSPPGQLQDVPSPLLGLNLLRTWKGVLSDERVALAQARFLQFQDHVQQLVDEKQANVAVMKDYFRFLPPLGFLPVTLASLLNLVGSPASSAGGAGTHVASHPFLSELRIPLQARLAAEGSAGSLVNRGVDGFDYARFFDSKQYFWIRSRMNDFVLDVQGSNKQAGAPIISFPRNDPTSDNQLWYFEDGYVISRLNGDVLTGSDREVISSDRNTWMQLTVSPKNNPPTPNQQWSIDTDGCLVSAFKSYVADIEFGGPSAAPVISYPKNSPLSPHQQWYLDPYVADTSSAAPFVINQALVEGALITSLLQQSWYDDAIDVAQLYNPAPASFPALNVYFVRENQASSSSPPYILVVRARRPFVWSISPQ